MIEQIKDFNAIEFYLRKDGLFKDIFDVEEWNFILIPPFAQFFLIKEDAKVMGILFIVQESQKSISFHGGLHKEYRGTGVEILIQFLTQLKSSFPKCKLWTKISSTNTPAKKLVERTGLIQFATLPESTSGGDLLFYRYE